MNTQCDEVWKQTKYELYEVSNKGSVRNKKRNKILKVEVKGYTSKVNITINNKTKKSFNKGTCCRLFLYRR